MQKYEIHFIVNKKFTHQGRLDITQSVIQSTLNCKGIVTGISYLGIIPIFLKKNKIEKNKLIIIEAYLNPILLKNLYLFLKQNNNIINSMLIKKREFNKML